MNDLDVKKKVIDLYLARNSQEKISEIMGMPTSEVSRILQDQGINHTVAKNGMKPIIKGD